MEAVKNFFAGIFSQFGTMTVIDFIDIAIVAILIYYFYVFIRARRAGKLAIGVLLFLAVLAISSIFHMTALNFILRNLVQVGLIAILIIFQPELRSMLEKVGEQPIRSFNKLSQQTKQDIEKTIDQIGEAVAEFSMKHTGALLVFERQTKLGDIVKSGTVIDAECSTFLIRNIFYDKAPLHDGAAVIRNGRIYAAGCFLPLSTQEIDLNLGTRHRAALGMSENSDAMIIVVSEETGNISIAQNGILKKYNNISKLKAEMRKQLITDENEKSGNLLDKFTSKIKSESKEE